ncbi:hypothetical protein PHYBLDRAFT_62119 [Phycomyces blakesleeanus NRRL 1555(-)]|uniref:Uncharacterized protein n=1 Tax=Phycomyces blakesleeanus (strain ATCC 8743b / DSM 1359 / FGSC 10004 / NBRC 33097 / NRRL 1555) TaxID=763407 RepID=A0A167R821_PHYB8|nr:hypothetical protein PHYBLDRAFT_62119 [Phycomyces blakesleeanus NRRL 1555(-)]OAD81068.1 hypothetical protein PHYBLDRAFT_62119 [Phycomyces blakesleeanus NRRL 1555(-)]|eukprot:XP_018299108.1 hypothetical protein PHYBLDRAFT_62119 [Phycomyces blakesleeanus NRRL 1555(-)]
MINYPEKYSLSQHIGNIFIMSESFTVFQAAKFQDNTHKLKSIEGHDTTQTNCQLIDLTSQLKATTLLGSLGGWYGLWVSWILQLRVRLFEYWHILCSNRLIINLIDGGQCLFAQYQPNIHGDIKRFKNDNIDIYTLR